MSQLFIALLIIALPTVSNFHFLFASHGFLLDGAAIAKKKDATSRGKPEFFAKCFFPWLAFSTNVKLVVWVGCLGF